MSNQVLPITILAVDGPILYAYLSMLRILNLKVERIVYLAFSNNLFFKTPDFFLNLRMLFLLHNQRMRYTYWPTLFRIQHLKLYETLTSKLCYHFDIDSAFFDFMFKKNTAKYVTKKIDKLIIKDFSDLKLKEYLNKHDTKLNLYSGGGILPAELLNTTNCKFLHIHPGYLPFVRGADGILWSTLLRDKPAATAFFLSTGLDEGDILIAEEFSKPKLNLFPSISEAPIKLDELYKLTYSFYDPLIRALAFKNLLYSSYYLKNLLPAKQNLNEGVTYRFMHKFLLKMAFEKIYCYG